MLAADVVDGQDAETSSTNTSTSMTSLQANSVRAHLLVESVELRTTIKHRRRRRSASITEAGGRPPCQPVLLEAGRMSRRASAAQYRNLVSRAPVTHATTTTTRMRIHSRRRRRRRRSGVMLSTLSVVLLILLLLFLLMTEICLASVTSVLLLLLLKLLTLSLLLPLPPMLRLLTWEHLFFVLCFSWLTEVAVVANNTSSASPTIVVIVIRHWPLWKFRGSMYLISSLPRENQFPYFSTSVLNRLFPQRSKFTSSNTVITTQCLRFVH